MDKQFLTFKISAAAQVKEQFKQDRAYLQEKQRQELTGNLRLRADIDYLAIMSGVEI